MVVLSVLYFLLRCIYPGVACTENPKCVTSNPQQLRRALGVLRWLVSSHPAPSECVLSSTSRGVGAEERDWIFSDDGDKWSVKLDVLDLECHLDTTQRQQPSTLSGRVTVVSGRNIAVWSLPLDFWRKLSLLRTEFIPAALHGDEASLISLSCFTRLRCAFSLAVRRGRRRWLVQVLFSVCFTGLVGVTLVFVLSGPGFG